MKFEPELNKRKQPTQQIEINCRYGYVSMPPSVYVCWLLEIESIQFLAPKRKLIDFNPTNKLNWRHETNSAI